MKIATVIGARPQFIKAAIVSSHIKRKDEINEIIIHTGQHYDKNMSDVFFDELNIPVPSYNLNIGSATHGKQTGRMIEAIEKILFEEHPDKVLLYGDTNSTLAGAIAASKLNIKIAHVEAGMRSFNKTIPEEINRIITDRVSDILFCPTTAAVENLKNEGMRKGVYLVGDVMYDSILYFDKISDVKTELHKKLNLNEKDAMEKYILVTIHRQENTDCIENLSSILNAMSQIKEEIVLPLHPRTKKTIEKEKLSYKENIKIIEPVSYREMLSLEKNAHMILTDSGGVQKEAFIFNVPCITFREETEWVETVENGMNKLTGASTNKILDAYDNFSGNRENLHSDAGKVYGNGKSASKIIDILLNNHKN
ncbi:MAG: UDP-N-acetylglucosamine 2-epimerase (non-hydrolyzing) [Nitrospinota bacterium]|jgi:UDP-GlcNAc3NAcA epimerase|nr:UDP-N-acetylglucosamine 2-epimerase (non-hydrolyzing) [Nitrospinota bacterium]|tara:strand:- start:6182 stop:7279 length:1098 start_codon:yes stop_codon:yes gene_type:complete